MKTERQTDKTDTGGWTDRKERKRRVYDPCVDWAWSPAHGTIDK